MPIKIETAPSKSNGLPQISLHGGFFPLSRVASSPPRLFPEEKPLKVIQGLADRLIRREMFPGDLLGGHAMPGVVPLNLLGGRDRILKRNKRNEAFPDGEPLGPAGLLQQNRSAEG